jgi:hypothetical protein
MVDTTKERLQMDLTISGCYYRKNKSNHSGCLGGVPCDYDKIFEIVESKKHLFQPENEIQKANGRVICYAEAAHAFGALVRSKRWEVSLIFQTSVSMQ